MTRIKQLREQVTAQGHEQRNADVPLVRQNKRSPDRGTAKWHWVAYGAVDEVPEKDQQCRDGANVIKRNEVRTGRGFHVRSGRKVTGRSSHTCVAGERPPAVPCDHYLRGGAVASEWLFRVPTLCSLPLPAIHVAVHPIAPPFQHVQLCPRVCRLRASTRITLALGSPKRGVCQGVLA